ncbi:MAG TPA: DUF1579 family protein [Candidatus Aquilonibacter sp.]|nr:DUF1579 family protein [Candidatus Aquilonibacter sp.]
MKIAWALLLLFISGGVALAQMEMPKPAPELKKIDVFAGSWTLNGTLKPSAMGPGGTMIETEKCEWMQGGFYLVCNTDYKGTMGSGVGTSYMGYTPQEKAYTYREFNSYGEFDDSRGTVDGDTWTWKTGDYTEGGKTMTGKFIVKMTSATSYNFEYDMSQDGTNWSMVMEGKATKK